MSHADLAQMAPEPGRAAGNAKSTSVLTRALVLVLCLFLVGYIVLQARTLWSEVRALSVEHARAQASVVVGYLNINPNPSYAASPQNWIRDEGEQMLLWSGWTPGVGHGWFKVGRGEIDRSHLSYPMGRDVVQAIDQPIVEIGGGKRWKRIPSNAPVVGLILRDVPCVYPLLLLRKVEVVNDEIARHPVMITYMPFVPEDEAVHVYDSMLDGHRVTMGLSGYLHDRKPVLYDRGTESFWVEQDGALTAIAGDRKGARLPIIAHPTPILWSAWQAQHPDSRLVVGADRSMGIPAQ
jgi:hypothetical protein